MTSHFYCPRGSPQHHAGRLGVGVAAGAFEPVTSKLAKAGVKGQARTMVSQVKVTICHTVFATLVSARMSAALLLGRVAGKSPTGTVIGLTEQEDSW